MNPSYMLLSPYSKLPLEKCFYGAWFPLEIHTFNLLLLSSQVSWQNLSCDEGQVLVLLWTRREAQGGRRPSPSLSLTFLPFGIATEHGGLGHCSHPQAPPCVVIRLLKNTSR